MKMHQQPPETLYKYLNVSRSDSFLKNPGVSFSSVYLFEDPQEGMCDYPDPKLDEPTKKILRSVYEDSPYGILCLCEDPVNSTMWGKYAENHQGILVGFDPSHCFFRKNSFENGWNKIKYTDVLPKLPKFKKKYLSRDLPQKFRENCFDVFKEAILRKDKKFSYESEWRKRRVLSKPRRWDEYPFPRDIIHNIIRSICMGANISQQLEAQCKEFAQKHKIILHRQN